MMRYSVIEIPPHHRAYDGHFPGNPLLPGAVLLDEILFAIADEESISPERCVIGVAKFKHFAGPGAPLELGFERIQSGAFRFELRSAAALVVEGTVEFQ